jgi:hypothetical protein
MSLSVISRTNIRYSYRETKRIIQIQNIKHETTKIKIDISLNRFVITRAVQYVKVHCPISHIKAFDSNTNKHHIP